MSDAHRKKENLMPSTADLNTDVLATQQPSAPFGAMPGLAVDKCPDAPFLSDAPWPIAGRTVSTAGELAGVVDDFADLLWAAGVRACDVIAVVQRNHGHGEMTCGKRCSGPAGA
jgi:hypothetical protein